MFKGEGKEGLEGLLWIFVISSMLMPLFKETSRNFIALRTNGKSFKKMWQVWKLVSSMPWQMSECLSWKQAEYQNHFLDLTWSVQNRVIYSASGLRKSCYRSTYRHKTTRTATFNIFDAGASILQTCFVAPLLLKYFI